MRISDWSSDVCSSDLLTNAYLKRCVKKGLIKVSQAPANRYAYYLTPTGFAEKSRLTAEYLSHSFRFFRDARTQCADAMAKAAGQGWHTIAPYGMTELARLASPRRVPVVDERDGKERREGRAVDEG